MNCYKRFFTTLLLFFLISFSIPVFAQETEVPSEQNGYRKSDEENFANAVLLQGLNKITAHSMMFEIPVNSAVKFGNLEIRLESCWKSAPDEKPESAALLQVWEQKPGEEKKQIFFGWMFASTPSISSIEHSVYDLTVLECRKK